MRRWTLLLAGAALWLFLAAIPALADGGPHVAALNSGQSGLTADSCAGCHRAHTAQSAPEDGRGTLLAEQSVQALCISCHGATGLGATTNVVDGYQYADGAMPPVRGSAIIGALRGGGFVNAQIDSSHPYRSASEQAKVSVLPLGSAASLTNVTSAHMKLDAADGNKVTLQGIAWGNSDGTFSSTANPGPAVSVTCTTCHNPHGNGMYRILRPIPNPTGLIVATAAANVTDYLVGTPPAVPATTRNYTVIQTNAAGTRIYLASDVLAGETAGTWTNTAGDYFHRRVPWNAASGNDAPNGLTSSSTGYSPMITAWCSTCHTRYMNSGESGFDDSTDAIFKYRHATTGSRSCTTCHVAHGSNAQMTGPNSAAFPYPGGTPKNASSRLLKIDNRGTCQMCHNPTDVVVGDSSPTPPSVP